MSQADVSFSVSRPDSLLIDKIAARAMGLFRPRDHYKFMDCSMDITAVHANGNPLRLSEFLAADDFNFAHDIRGIRNCIDRETGGLLNHFRPRFSVPAKRKAA